MALSRVTVPSIGYVFRELSGLGGIREDTPAAMDARAMWNWYELREQ